MNLTIIGTGYVGLVTGACFAEMGHTVTCVDVDKEKIENLKRGIIPIYEPGLESIVQNNINWNRLFFTTSLPEAMQTSDVYFIAVGTPPGEDGSADLRHVLGVAQEIGRNLNKYALVVNKSTVPVGTADKVRSTIEKETSVEFDIASNPEFLKEGEAVNDFMRPDRIVVGVENDRAEGIMKELYSDFNRNHERLIVMGLRDAEMTKYVANAMLATRISFMNEIANICDHTGVDVENVRVGIGSDSRIGYSFLYPGCGYGGSCFPKDVRALIHTALDHGVDPDILSSVHYANKMQKRYLFKKIERHFNGNLEGKVFAVWGLSFKPGTDDTREAPSKVLIAQLRSAGATVVTYDPVVRGPESAEDQYSALKDADALVLVTEWKMFRHPDFALMRQLMKPNPVIFDGRNIYDKPEGFIYYGVGR